MLKPYICSDLRESVLHLVHAGRADAFIKDNK